MSKGFRILNINIGEVSFPISKKVVDKIEKNFFTVIIGNNATGKSRLLVNILNILRQQLNPRIKVKENIFKIEYLYNNKLNYISNLNQNAPDNIDDLHLLSISNSLFDKFPHNVKSDNNYSYVGARNQGINTHKRAIINDLMDVFNENLDDKQFLSKTKELFNFLKIEPFISISLRKTFGSTHHRYFEFLKYSKTSESLQLYLKDLTNKGFYRQQSKILEKYSNDLDFLENFVKFIKSNNKIFTDKSNNRLPDFFFQINLNNSDNSNEKFLTEFRFISLLRRLNLLTYESVLLKKGDFQFDIQDSSTGEIGLLMTFVRAIPELKSNSIIFIDEPEISLHPSWQLKYIELLKKFLNGYTGCHVLIATHSHFILSDLKENFSSVVVLNNIEGKFSVDLKEYTPFGWSPEAILYEVFGVATVRNHFFEYDLKTLLSLISNRSKDYGKINKYIDKINKFEFTTGDPLHKIIKEAKKYVQNKEK
ncbi:AAA family ATPase [Chryseobacterium sp. 'Rf worker isolate 10']|uniref:AAA family ATPase n=1 Tax=Chryseobacterium sp. 'Rf worker isolate 10' TaxID=2887348 RepID=UPI003D6DAC91